MNTNNGMMIEELNDVRTISKPIICGSVSQCTGRSSETQEKIETCSTTSGWFMFED